MATHSSILSGEFHEQTSWKAIVHGVTKSWTHLSTHTDAHTQTLFCPIAIIGTELYDAFKTVSQERV